MKTKSAAVVCLACVVGGVSLFVMATRPCEPRAQAATEAPVQKHELSASQEPTFIQIPEMTVVAQVPSKHLAHPAHKSGGECTNKTPGVRVSEEDLVAGSGGTVTFYDCR